MAFEITTIKVGIIGTGRIGTELLKRGTEKGWEIITATASGVYAGEGEKIGELDNWFEYFRKLDIICLCIPTLDDGEIAFRYIKPLVENGKPVVTCEKGSLGNYFPELKPWIDKIGYSATVGGGTRLLHWLKERLTPGIKEIHLIINGTLNYIFDGLSRGRTLDEMVEEAKRLGYAEPGAHGLAEVINTEAGKDIPMKTSVLLNICGFGEIRAKNIDVQTITEEDLKRLAKEAISRRYIVSITREENKEDMVGGFKFDLGGWHVSAGFKNCSNPLLLQLVLPGVSNAALIHGLDGIRLLKGPGAGAVSTVGSMMKDIENLLKV